MTWDANRSVYFQFNILYWHECQANNIANTDDTKTCHEIKINFKCNYEIVSAICERFLLNKLKRHLNGNNIVMILLFI